MKLKINAISIFTVFILLTLLTISYYKHMYFTISNVEVQKIYANLKVNTGMSDTLPPLVILESATVNAWATPEQITITTAMLAEMSNKDQVAFVLAHEIGHVVLGHFDLEKMPSKLKENSADKYGSYLVLRSGYDVCQGKNLWVEFVKKFGDAISVTHPSGKERIDSLDFPICR